MASWGPSGSILEASGLHFGGSGPHFRRLWTSYLEPRTPRTPKNLQKQKLHHKVARPPKGGWAAVTPPGGFNPPATEGVPTACWIHFQLALSNHSWPISTFFRAIRSEVFLTPILSFPQEGGGPPQTRRQKAEKFGFFAFFLDFLPFRTALEK